MIRIVQVGLGPLGQKIVQQAAARPGIALVGAVDTDPTKIGQDLGLLCGLKRKLGVTVSANVASAARGKKAHAAILATVSDIAKLAVQVEEAARAGLDVVSTCEELCYPWEANARAAGRIDRACRRQGVSCVGTGVNPGFLMDQLPISLTAVCSRVDRIEVVRVQDASKRRGPFQKKIGAGLDRADFRRLVKEGKIRHVGLPESMRLIASAMGWRLDECGETIRPVMAKRAFRTPYVKAAAGQVIGVEQIGRGRMGGREVLRLHFRAALGEKRSHDTVRIEGSPALTSTIAGGVNGDLATCAIALNMIPSVVSAAPGLRTMPELATGHWFMASH
jgi:4-hydroxy-tetrahydrodipicolinate reductase